MALTRKQGQFTSLCALVGSIGIGNGCLEQPALQAVYGNEVFYRVIDAAYSPLTAGLVALAGIGGFVYHTAVRRRGR